MTQVVFIRFEGGPLDLQHVLFERGDTASWPPPRYAYFVRSGGAITVWAATAEGSKPGPLEMFKLARYRRISCSIPEDAVDHGAVHGALYRHDPTHEESLDLP